MLCKQCISPRQLQHLWRRHHRPPHVPCMPSIKDSKPPLLTASTIDAYSVSGWQTWAIYCLCLLQHLFGSARLAPFNSQAYITRPSAYSTAKRSERLSTLKNQRQLYWRQGLGEGILFHLISISVVAILRQESELQKLPS
jgi:hypothetical protein